MNKRWSATDNSKTQEKIAMRIKYLPGNAKVLDLFCGLGEMYHGAYKDRAKEYYGIDIEKVHDSSLCEINNNVKYVMRNDIGKYNVFDLDDYGSPWKLFYLIVRKIPEGEYVFYITDGLVLHQKVDGAVTKFVSGTEQIPSGMNLPGINRFYVDIFKTMLRDLEKRYNCEIKKVAYFHNDRRTVYYWALEIKKN
jgi:hypothetical protein